MVKPVLIFAATTLVMSALPALAEQANDIALSRQGIADETLIGPAEALLALTPNR